MIEMISRDERRIRWIRFFPFADGLIMLGIAIAPAILIEMMYGGNARRYQQCRGWGCTPWSGTAF